MCAVAILEPAPPPTSCEKEVEEDAGSIEGDPELRQQGMCSSTLNPSSFSARAVSELCVRV